MKTKLIQNFNHFIFVYYFSTYAITSNYIYFILVYNIIIYMAPCKFDVEISQAIDYFRVIVRADRFCLRYYSIPDFDIIPFRKILDILYIKWKDRFLNISYFLISFRKS